MSSTWEIEYRGQLADGASGGDKRSLAAWGLASFDLSVLNLDRGNLSLVVSGETPFVADLPWAYRDKIILWRNGSRYWHGWLTREPRAASDQADSISLIFGDPYWWLDQTAMTDPVVTNAVTGPLTIETSLGTLTMTAVLTVDWTEPSGAITWSWRDQSLWTVQGQIRRALYAAIRSGAPVALGTIGIDAPAAAQETPGATALSYLQAAVTYEPLAVGWWDYSGVTPTLHVQPRSALTSLTYDLGSNPAGVQCEALRELQALAVRIRWTFTEPSGDPGAYTEQAGNNSLPIGPNVLVIDADAGDHDALIDAIHYGIAARMYAALGPLAYAGSLALTDDISALATARPGIGLNLTGGRTEWATMAGIIQQVSVSVVAEAESLVVTWGAPRHLGLQDWQSLRDIGGDAAANAHWDKPDDPTTDDKKPGTYDDLNNTPAASPAGAIRIETKGGTWTKCGWQALDVSQPTRRWRTKSQSGSATYSLTDGGGATVGTSTATWSGSRTYDAATCAASGLFSEVGTNRTCDGAGAYTDTAENPHTPDGLAEQSRTATSITYGGSAGSWGSGGECGSTSVTATAGSCAITLSAEDTETDAIARRMATATWTDTVTVAIRTVPVTVATGIYDELRWGTYNASSVYTPITGLSPWHRYRIIGKIEMQPVDELGSATGDWTETGEASAVFIASLDGTGGAEWQYIYPTPGYRTRVTGLHVEEW